MARKLTKNDDLIWQFLLINTGCYDIPHISEKVKLGQVKVLVSLTRLLNHGLIRRINNTYQAL